jgi:hypothetical protein
MLADPEHAGTFFVRHIGMAVLLLLAGLALVVFVIGSTIEVSAPVHADGILEAGAGRCRELAMPSSPYRPVPQTAWCARLWIDDVGEKRTLTGARVLLRLSPRGPLLQGRVVASIQDPGTASLEPQPILVLPDAATPAPMAIDGLGPGGRPVRAEVLTAPRPLRYHWAQLLAHLLGRPPG